MSAACGQRESCASGRCRSTRSKTSALCIARAGLPYRYPTERVHDDIGHAKEVDLPGQNQEEVCHREAGGRKVNEEDDFVHRLGAVDSGNVGGDPRRPGDVPLRQGVPASRDATPDAAGAASCKCAHVELTGGSYQPRSIGEQ
ncbi:transmembrane amino acid transporter, putative [Babesia ovata]|uniref:Transmembrane amino acid transporter, putative n=1 Tax=Babesia ovata TaxID=189622 RepID=A0A2H6K8J9_9APIC|nr:transmembrane amino acid transporter, putative [Babesia ovata]GBE59332.1 transmembrane amino acid transporter, putative [Babesia ovata]